MMLKTAIFKSGFTFVVFVCVCVCVLLAASKLVFFSSL